MAAPLPLLAPLASPYVYAPAPRAIANVPAPMVAPVAAVAAAPLAAPTATMAAARDGSSAQMALCVGESDTDGESDADDDHGEVLDRAVLKQRARKITRHGRHRHR